MANRTVQYRGHLYLPPSDNPAILSSTNASPIVVTTAAAHGLTTGDVVRIEGHQTNTAANGVWEITVVDTDEFSLDDSTGDGVGGETGTLWVSELTFDHDTLAIPPEVASPIVRPVDGRVENASIQVELVDVSEAVTAVLSDAGGRAALKGRLLDIERNVDAGGWEFLFTGRVTAADLNDDLSSYILSVDDERWVERKTTLFKGVTATSQLYPPGLVEDFFAFNIGLGPRYFPAAGTVRAKQIEPILGNPAPVEEWVLKGAHSPLSQTAWEYLQADYIPGEAAFETVKAELDGTEYDLVFWSEPEGLPSRPSPIILISDPDSDYSVGDTADFRLIITSSDAGETNPYHVGGANGVDPFQFVQDCYDNVHGGNVPVRYDASLFTAYDATTNPDGLLGRFPVIHLRETETANMAQYLEDHIYRVYGVVPFIDSQGRVAPRVVRLPIGVDPDTLTTLDEDNTSAHPTYHYSTRDAVSKVTVTWEGFSPVTATDEESDYDYPVDGIRTKRYSLSRDHDRVTDVGDNPVTIDVRGVHWGITANALLDMLAQEIFDRFGDGPVDGVVEGLPSTETIQPGDYVKFDLDSYPNLSSGSRGGIRIVQILRRRISPDGPTFEYLDAGPSANPLAPPTVTVTQNGTTPKHVVDVAIGSLATGGTYVLEVDRGDGRGYQLEATGTAEETVYAERCPSGTEISARARVTKVGRIGSVWGTEDSVTTDSLTAPSSLSATPGPNCVSLTWTNGETAYDIMPTVDGEDFLEEPLPAGSTWFRFQNVGQTTKAFGVKHVDDFGGASSITSINSAGTAAEALTAPNRLRVLQGWSDTEPKIPEQPKWGSGVELAWNLGETAADSVVQYDTDVAFGTDPKTVRVYPGQGTVRVHLPASDTTHYFRVRHEREGSDYTDSSWSSIVSAKPTFFSRDVGPDGFPAGWAFLSVNNSGVMQINVGSSDPDTTAAYYKAVLNPGVSEWPEESEVTTGSNAITSSQMPYSGNLLDNADPPVAIDYTDGDLVFATVRFYNNRLAWGQTVYCTYPPSWLSVPRVDVIPGDTTLTLEISDPAGVVTGVYFKPVSGAGEWDFSDPYDGSWTEDSAEPYASSVTLDKKHNSAIGWAVAYDLGSGGQWLGRQCVVFDVDLEPEGTGVAVIAADGESSCKLFGDNDVLSWKVAASTSASPADSTVRAESAINHNSPGIAQVGTLVTAKDGETVYYKAFPYSATDAGGTEGAAVTFEGKFTNELNQISVAGWHWKRDGLFAWDVVIDIKALDGVASINVEYTFWDESASTAYSRSYNQNIGGDTSYTLPDTFEQGDAVGNGTFLDNIRITPYDDVGGDAGSGNAGTTRVVYGMEAYSTSGTFQATYSPQDVIVSSASDPGATNYPPGTLWFKE